MWQLSSFVEREVDLVFPLTIVHKQFLVKKKLIIILTRVTPTCIETFGRYCTQRQSLCNGVVTLN